MDREQPLEETFSPVSEEKNNNVVENEVFNGSQSKFKDVKSLEEAYKNLQSEFTRKCQKLSELEKNNTEKDNIFKNDNLTNNDVKPFYESEQWDEEVLRFLEKNPNAKNDASEIVDIIVKDKDLQKMPNSLEIAYNKLLAKNYKSKEELVKDENFLNNYIFNNNEIQEKIINNYISKLKQNSAPQVISTSKFSSFGLTPNLQPKNLDEAKKLAENMFKN